MNGNPLSFQLWINQQMRLGDIKYHMKIWYMKKELQPCINKGVCPHYFIPTSLEWNITPNALLLKQLASKYIQPVANVNISCTLMMLENLAKPEWISTPCTEKILTDIICVKQNRPNEGGFPRFDTKKIYLEITSTIFQCNNGKIISSVRQCNGFMDCSDGEDEIGCSCFVSFKPKSDSYYCRYNCKKPKCFCSELFFQSHTTGCFQYKPLVPAQSGQPEHSKMKRQLLFTCTNETVMIQRKLVNDLIPDCHANVDENILFSMLTNNYEQNITKISSRYSSKEHRLCFEGHPKFYHISKECIYEVDHNGILQTCRNGKHLQNCFQFNCQKYFKFKCPKYYCIPMGYVCNGRIDCPGGVDEIHCLNHSCIGLFNCWNTSQCIYVADVCDGVKDCLNGDDESSCQLQQSKCPKQCFCLGFAVSCTCDFNYLTFVAVLLVFNMIFTKLSALFSTKTLLPC